MAEDTWYMGLVRRTTNEADYIVNQFKNINVGYVRSPEGGIAYMYVKGRLLTREQYLRAGVGPVGPDGPYGPVGPDGKLRPTGLLEVLQELHAPVLDITRVAGDVVLLTIPGGDGGIPDDDPRAVPNLLDRIDTGFVSGAVTPDHVLTAAANGGQGEPSPCPATEPQEVYGPWQPYPGLCPGDGGTGVQIFLADTGLLLNAATEFPWLQGVTGEDDPRSGPGDAIQPYDGHGTFVAGVIRAMAPGAGIYVANVFDTAGSAVESDIALKLNAALAQGADIIHLTIASPSRNNQPMIGLEAWLAQLPLTKGVVCVAAAGNNGNNLPCWPGAFPGVVSVGALASDWRSRAYFSCYGGWVDMYAPGQYLVNAFASGTYACQISPYTDEVRSFSGMAMWSGTSFSTPIVTGRIAARMTERGESAHEAAAALLDEARARAIPGVGPVLLPCCRSSSDCERRGGGCGGCGCGGCGCGGCGCGCGCGGDRGCGCRPYPRVYPKLCTRMGSLDSLGLHRGRGRAGWVDQAEAAT